MPTQQDVSNHYTHGDLAAAIRSGIESLGKTINSVTVDDLAHDCSGCFRLERLPGGTCTHWKAPPLSRRTRNGPYPLPSW
jgi:hypothetical protein